MSGFAGRRPFFSVLIPIFNSDSATRLAIPSLLSQTCQDFEVLVGDDSTDPGSSVRLHDYLVTLRDSRFSYVRNDANLGYPRNLRQLFSRATGEWILLLAQDDILKPSLLEQYRVNSNAHPDCGVMTRLYYWFDQDPFFPIRVIKPLGQQSVEPVALGADPISTRKVIETVGQLTGLAYRRDQLRTLVHDDVFVAHIYPFLDVWSRTSCLLFDEYLVAVGVEESQTRFLKSIYARSPNSTWIEMLNHFQPQLGHDTHRELSRYITSRPEALAQVRITGGLRSFLREVKFDVSKTRRNYISPSYLSVLFICLVFPRRILRFTVDFVKRFVVARDAKRVVGNHTFGVDVG